MNSFLRERIYYEIAMSIGNSLDLDLMLKESLSTYLRKLNCLAGAVLLYDKNDTEISFKTSYAIPKRLNRNSVLRTAIENIPTFLSKDEFVDYIDELPLSIAADNHNQYVMNLPGVGLLVLVKSQPGLSLPDIKSLLPLNNKLADACRSCIANEQLHREIIERELAEEKFRSIFENSVEGIFQSTVQGKFLDANPALARLLKYDSPEQLLEECTDIGRQLYVNPEVRNQFIRRLKKRGSLSSFEGQFYKRDGSIGWGSLSARIINDSAGNPLRIEGMFSDITPRRNALRALRTAKDEAVRLNNMKSSFLSMVSHELRTPLTSILGFAKLIGKHASNLASDDVSANQKRKIQRIEENSNVIISEGERLTELINNVLDLAKLESGSCQWNVQGVSINDILEHSIIISEVLFDESEVELSQDLAPNLPRIQGDQDRLIQLMLNLINNAAKFTLEGSVHISSQQEGGDIIVQVADTGIGIPMSEQSLIFDKFRQSGNTLTDKPRGTGLGLPICKEIVEYHGGQLWLESKEGEGSTFSFSIPIVQ